MTWFHAARARWRLLSRPAAESRMDEEIRFHIQMETERLMREDQLDRDEARRRALVRFGGVQQHREALRDGRGTVWLGSMSLDLRLGGRMLLKYPGLTIIGGLAMAFGIWFGAVTFEMMSMLQSANLPLPDGHRIVQVRNWDVKANEIEGRVLHDFQLWRSSVHTITDLGAYRDASPNVVGVDGSAHPAVAAEISASAFRIAPEPPLLGRVLQDTDEHAGAPPVVVLGHPVWRDRFASDPAVVGRIIRVGSGYATVVGVMPEGYAFPVSHELWLPFRPDIAGSAPRTGPSLTVFGRLAPGATVETAQAELTPIGRRLAAQFPATHAELQPQVRPYAQAEAPGPDEIQMTLLIYGFVIVLLIVVSSNVALLLFARAASREAEILVRSALGASRRRLIAQLFAEALVLGGVAAAAALVAAQLALTNLGRPYLEMNYGRLPFWYEFNLSPMTILVAAGLAILGAVIAGVVPARKITRGLGTQLKVGTAGGGGVKFGGVWTAVIVTQVALTVALPAVVLLLHTEIKRVESFDVGFRADQYLGVHVSLEEPAGGDMDSAATEASRAHLTGVLELLRRRLEAEPGVAGVTFVDALPRDYHPARRVQLVSLGNENTHIVRTAAIDPSYFDVLRQPPRAGRAFTLADLGPASRVVIVDEIFVDQVMQGRNPIGHQMRIGTRAAFDSAAADLPLYEIVGVVKELGMTPVAQSHRDAGIYLPVVPGSQGAVEMLVHANGDPVSVAPRVRELATAIEPALRIGTMQQLDRIADPFLWFLGLWLRMMIGLTAIALLLSLAGIYAVLAYIVARRTREIGVRVALGSSARRIVLAIFRRPLRQVALGVLAGSILVGAATGAVRQSEQFAGLEQRGLSVGDVSLLLVHATLMLAVCLLACVVPTVRALRVEPTDALRAE